MFRVIIHFAVLCCFAAGISRPAQAAEEQTPHNTGSSTTDAAAEKPTLKERVKAMSDDPNTADSDKLNEMEAELNKHEKEKTLGEEEIKELREKIADIRKTKGDKTGDGKTAGGDSSKDSGAVAKSLSSGSKSSTESSASPTTSGISGATDSLRTNLTGGSLAATEWASMATLMSVKADTAQKLAPQATPSSVPDRSTSFIPQTVPSSSNAETRPSPQQASNAGGGAGAAAGANAVVAQPTAPTVNNALVSSSVAPTSALTDERKFFSESQESSSNNNVTTVPTVVAESAKPTAAAAASTPAALPTAPVATSAPVTTIGNSGPSTSIPKAIATSGPSTVRTEEAPNQVEVTGNFTFTDTKPTPSSGTTVSAVVTAPVSEPGGGDAVPRTMNSGTSPAQAASQTSASDTVIDRTASEWAEGKAITSGSDESQRTASAPAGATPSIFSKSTDNLNTLTQANTINPPTEEDFKSNRGLRESEKNGTSVATLTESPIQATTSDVVISGALGIINNRQ